jgi:hypothetical protein
LHLDHDLNNEKLKHSKVSNPASPLANVGTNLKELCIPMPFAKISFNNWFKRAIFKLLNTKYYYIL